MLKPRISIIYFSFVLYFMLLSARSHSQLQKIYLNPKSTAVEKQSKFIDSIRLIPLEVKEDIELEFYNSVDVTKKYFLIKDYTNKKILVYSRNGNFVKKINYKVLAEGVPPYYDEHNEQIVCFGYNKNYMLTPRDRLKIRMDWSNPRNKKYFKKYTIDLNDTSFAIKKNTPDQNDIIRAHHYYDEYYWQSNIATGEFFKDSVDYEFKIYKDHNLVKGLFPYNPSNETRFLYTEENVNVNTTEVKNVHIITRPFYDTIYKIVNDSLFAAYQLVLPLENSLPQSFFTKAFKNKTERENFNRNNARAFHQVDNFYETPRFVYFSVEYLSNYESYIYQKQTNITYKIKNIKPDSSQYNLQLLADYGMVRKGNRFYKTQKAGDLLTFFSQNKNVKPPGEIENFLKSNPHPTTPVIVEFKFKNGN